MPPFHGLLLLARSISHTHTHTLTHSHIRRHTNTSFQSGLQCGEKLRSFRHLSTDDDFCALNNRCLSMSLKIYGDRSIASNLLTNK